MVLLISLEDLPCVCVIEEVFLTDLLQICGAFSTKKGQRLDPVNQQTGGCSGFDSQDRSSLGEGIGRERSSEYGTYVL